MPICHFTIGQKGFEKQLGKFCGKSRCNLHEEDTRYGSYETFEEAADACINDNKCQMVMDHQCDDKGHFQLCNATNLCDSGHGSCIYKKPFGN